MSDPGFVHLRVHTEYSVSDSIVRIEALVERAVADRQPAIAVTDLANLFGWVKFYKAARARGLKPICGVDAWLTNEPDRDRPFRMLLLARDRTGYLRLCRLLSRAWIENEYRGRGELRAEWFDERDEDGRLVGEGLIALSGAQHGDVGQALLAGNASGAAELARAWARRFPGAWYLEVQRSGHPEAEAQTRAAAQLAARLSLPLVATHPVQFLERDDYRAHEARVCIAQGAVLADPRRVRVFAPEQHFRTRDEMAELFADLPSALANSVEIARRCNVSMVLGKPQLPQFPTPDGVSLDDYLRAL
ncbi:MAG TPA: PHP domain-containing protein, partial [Zeimonas sp.]|nr:PHP domain-containing protein [Zeimonas sp.]